MILRKESGENNWMNSFPIKTFDTHNEFPFLQGRLIAIYKVNSVRLTKPITYRVPGLQYVFQSIYY